MTALLALLAGRFASVRGLHDLQQINCRPISENKTIHCILDHRWLLDESYVVLRVLVMPWNNLLDSSSSKKETTNIVLKWHNVFATPYDHYISVHVVCIRLDILPVIKHFSKSKQILCIKVLIWNPDVCDMFITL